MLVGTGIDARPRPCITVTSPTRAAGEPDQRDIVLPTAEDPFGKQIACSSVGIQENADVNVSLVFQAYSSQVRTLTSGVKIYGYGL
jgi:hypothetical protein